MFLVAFRYMQYYNTHSLWGSFLTFSSSTDLKWCSFEFFANERYELVSHDFQKIQEYFKTIFFEPDCIEANIVRIFDTNILSSEWKTFYLYRFDCENVFFFYTICAKGFPSHYRFRGKLIGKRTFEQIESINVKSLHIKWILIGNTFEINATQVQLVCFESI